MKIFIPIKDNSERVPKKNFRLFNNKKLFCYVIDRLLEHDFEIYVDTDSSEVMEYYKNTNVVVIERKPELRGHKTSVVDLIQSFIEDHNIDDYICQIHVTSPLLTPELLKEAYSMLNEYDSVTGCDILYKMFWKKTDGAFEPINHDPNVLIPTQDLDPLYIENSTFFMVHSSSVLKNHKRMSDNNYFFEVPFPQNLDIDTEDDLKFLKKFETER